MADEAFPHLDGERDELAVLRAQAITMARHLVHRIDHDEARNVAEAIVKAHVWAPHGGEHEHRNGRCTRCGAFFTGADLLDAIDKFHAEGGFGWADIECVECELGRTCSVHRETCPTCSGEGHVEKGAPRDEEVALAQWQRGRITELEADVARLTWARDELRASNARAQRAEKARDDALMRNTCATNLVRQFAKRLRVSEPSGTGTPLSRVMDVAERFLADADGVPAAPLMTVREAARRRLPLSGADAQAAEGALAETERERDDAREALRHAEEQLEAERQRVERLMAVEQEHHDVAFCNVCGGLRGQHDEYDGDPSYERQVDEDGRTLPDRCGEWTTPTEAVREIKRLMAVERAARRVVESWPHDTSLHAAIGALRIDLEATDGE